MTGHLVLSTVHTNDTISTPYRIIDMGVEPFIVAMSLLAVVAQRLIRLVCKNCAEPHQPDAFEYAWLALELGEAVNSYTFMKGKGCSQCNNTGYKGRMGFYSLLEMNDDINDAISRRDIYTYRELAIKAISINTIRYHAVQLVVAKLTTVSEAMWVSNRLIHQHTD